MNSNYIQEQIIWIGTQEEFNNLESLSENMIYFIIEEELWVII